MVERLDMDADGLNGEPVAALILEALGRGPLCPGRCAAASPSAAAGCRGTAVRGAGGVIRCGSREAIEFADEIDVVARRFLSAHLDRIEDRFDAVDGGENERDGFGRDRSLAAELPHHAFGGMRQRPSRGKLRKPQVPLMV